MNRHPHAYTLELLRLAIDHLPPTFSATRRKEFETRLGKFEADPKAGYDKIIDTISVLGKESWAHRQAYDELYRRYGRSSEEAHLLNFLDQGIRAKYEQFIHEGGKISHVEAAKSIEDMMKVSPFEHYFSPEEKFAIQQALLAAKEAAHKEIDDLITDGRREEFQKLAEEYQAKQHVIEAYLQELRDLSNVSPKWQEEILNKVQTFEEGWSVVERGVSEDTVEKEVEYWRGTLEAFLHA